tara:strand:- start:806 stop:928 length:123 start_codon:yes stop_codon:yes gene_type:complete
MSTIWLLLVEVVVEKIKVVAVELEVFENPYPPLPIGVPHP